MSHISSQSPLNTLFRGTSVAVKILSAFGSLSAEHFVPKVVSGPVKMVVANTASLQIIPAKAGTSDEAVLQRNRDRLCVLTQMFLDSIYASVNDTPRDLRKLFKVLHEELEVSIGSKLAMVFSVNLLFLRFICPVIVKPSDYRILDTQVPAEKVQDLIMVAKLLQTTANFTKFGGKEENMTDLNPFVERNAPDLRKYFLELIDVGSIRGQELDFDAVSALDTEFVEIDPATQETLSEDVRLSLQIDSSLLSSSLGILYQKTRRKSSGPIDSPNSPTGETRRLPEGFIMVPEYPVFKEEALTKPPTSVLVKQSTLLLIGLGPLFRKLLHSSPDSPDLKENEAKVCKELHNNPTNFNIFSKLFDVSESAEEQGRARLRKPSSLMETTTQDFIKILLSNDMVLLACIFDVLQLSNMTSVLTTLVYIFNYYNKMSRLVRFSVAHELISIYRKWENMQQ